MTQDEIIEMARQAGGYAPQKYPEEWRLDANDLERLAKLVVEKEREIWERRVVRLQNLMDLREQQPNKPCCIAEREACAQLVDEYANGLERNYSEIIADAIRARGQA